MRSLYIEENDINPYEAVVLRLGAVQWDPVVLEPLCAVPRALFNVLWGQPIVIQQLFG